MDEVTKHQLKTLEPWRLLKVILDNPAIGSSSITSNEVQFSIFDSPIVSAPGRSPLVGAMFVPKDRERDWKFLDKAGMMGLMVNFYNLNRLILISNHLPSEIAPQRYVRAPLDENDAHMRKLVFEKILIDMYPECSKQGSPTVNYLTYEENILCVDPELAYESKQNGLVLVENVEVEEGTKWGLRRRMIFKNCPHRIQSEALLVAEVVDSNGVASRLDKSSLADLKNMEQLHGIAKDGRKVRFTVDTSTIFQPNHQAMMAGLVIIGKHLQSLFENNVIPTALCYGVGGGVLASFLKKELAFNVAGVDWDENVFVLADACFGLKDDGSNIKLLCEDAFNVIKELANPSCDKYKNLKGSDYQVVLVDLSSADNHGLLSAPPRAFLNHDVVKDVSKCMDSDGVLIINAVCPDYIFNVDLVATVRKVFNNVYKIDLNKEREYVLVATSPSCPGSTSVSHPADHGEDDADGGLIVEKLRTLLEGRFVDSIVKI